MNITFITDFTEHDLQRGAELNGAALRSHLGIPIKVVRSREFEFTKSSVYIVGNRNQIKDTEREKLEESGSYILFEHDWGFAPGRVMSDDYKDHIIPVRSQRMRKLYDNAKSVICLSEIQREIFEKNLGREVLSCGISFFREDHLEQMRRISRRPKNGRTAIVQSKYASKGTTSAMRFCDQNNIDYDVVKEARHDVFMDILGRYNQLIFKPLNRESWSRLAVEARMMGLVVEGNVNVSVSSEVWWKNKELIGEKLISFYESVLLPRGLGVFRESLLRLGINL